MKLPPLLVLAITFITCAHNVRSNVTLPPIFSDHAVLAKKEKVPVWGKATPGEEITVTLEAQTVKTKADEGGKWSVALNLKNSGPGPFALVVQGANRLAISDVLVGEVWLAGGQSNMGFSLLNETNATNEIAASANPMLRQFRVERSTPETPAEECAGKWQVADPRSTPGFSAVGYYFGKSVGESLKVPVGIINSNWAGTPAESWISSESLSSDEDLKAGKETREKNSEDYLRASKAFVTQYEEWLADTGREDQPTANAADFAAVDAPRADWTPVTLPGSLGGADLPPAGVVWFRKEIDFPAGGKGPSLQLNLGKTDAVCAIYWNGRLNRKTTYQDLVGATAPELDTIPAALVKPGKNVLAVRLYDPAGTPAIHGAAKLGEMSLNGEWLVRTERKLPALDAALLAAVPHPPKAIGGAQMVPSCLYNGMIAPLVSFAINGVIWYQGEANASRAVQYQTTFPLLINDWRKRFNQGELPFYFCQLANFMAKKTQPVESAWAELREAQAKALRLPHTGAAVLIDLGESNDIHPRNKRDVGERLARLALANTYQKPIPPSGPIFKAATVENGAIRVQFTGTDGGLAAKPLPSTYVVRSVAHETAPLVRNSPTSEVEGFAVCGADHQWVWAEAKISGNAVLVSSGKVPAPVAVRYAWADNPTCNLYNGAGLPAAPFRTDDFPLSTRDARY